MPWVPSFEGERPTLGYLALDWIEENLVVPDGPSAGDPLVFSDEQAQFVLEFYEVDPGFTGPPIVGRSMVAGRIVRRAVLSRPKGWGKSPLVAAVCLFEALGPAVMDGWDADGQPVGREWHSLGFMPKVQIVAVTEDQPLALDTPVWTPNGWSTVGNLTIGDEVFASNGEATPISRVTPVFLNEDCYEVEFDDGEAIVASGNHQWTVQRLNGHLDAYETLTLTTAELVESRERYPRRLIRVPLVAVQGEDKALPIDPYLFGLWLGDGSTNDSSIAYDYAVHDEFMELLEPHVEQWEELVTHRGKGNVAVARPRRTRGICPRGHEYLNDKSNCLPSSGHPGCRKCNSGSHEGRKEPKLLTLRERLRSVGALGSKHVPHDYLTASYEQRMELLRGLVDSDGNINKKGQATFTNTDVELFDQVCVLLSSLGFRWYTVKASGTARRVRWQPRPGEPVAKLRHKAERQRQGNRDLSSHRRLRSVRKVSSVPVKCIGIDTEDHLFLAGERMTLTHNTANTWGPLLEMAREGPVARNYAIEPLETIVNVPRGLIECATSSGTSREGFRPVFNAMDQTESWVQSNGGVKLAATLRRNLGKVQGSSIETPNAYVPGVGSVAEMSRKAFDAQQSGEARRSTGVLFDHREAPADTDIYDEESLRRGLIFAYGDSADANGGWVSIDRIVEEFYDPDTAPQDARGYYLNQVTHAETSFVSQPDWGACVDVGKVVADRDVITLGFDGSGGRKSRGKPDATALIGCRVSDGHLFELGVWEVSSNPVEWPDWEPPDVEIDAVLRAVFAKYSVQAFYADPGPRFAAILRDWEGRWSSKVKVKASTVSPFHWSMNKTGLWQLALESFESAVTHKDLTHDGSHKLTQHIVNARRQVRGSRLTIGKEDSYSSNKMDAAVAAVLAWQARNDCVAKGVAKPRRSTPRRIR